MTLEIDTDLRAMLGPARDQGERPTCVAFAATAAHEARRGAPDFLSVEYLFFKGVQRSHKDPTRGLSPAAIAEALEHDGQPKEGTWPYAPQHPTGVWQPPAAAVVHQAKIVWTPRTLGGIRRSLGASCPVVLALDLTKSFYTPDALSRVRGKAGEKMLARHAVLAVGSAQDGGDRYLLVRNSWGLAWGDQGHAWLHDDYTTTHLLTTALI